MTVFNPTYNPRVYNALGDVKVVDKLVTDAELNGLGQIIVRYGVENLINFRNLNFVSSDL